MRAEILPYANVVVRVDGRKLKEYHIERSGDDAPNTATAYVEAKFGAHFSVDLELGNYFPHKEDHLKFSVSMDGINVRVIILTPGRHRHGSINGAINTTAAGSTLRRFAFADLVKTDEVAKVPGKKTLSTLGEIKVELSRCPSASIPEKALKGRALGSHKVLGIPEKCKDKSRVDLEYPYGRSPIATYIFRYRTHSDLENEGILKRSLSPVPLEDRDPDTLILEEGRELARRNKAERERSVAVKKEDQRLKRARSSNSTASSPSEPGPPNDDGEMKIAKGGRLGKRARRAAESEVIDLSAD
ncbi:hypothetical protein B0A48_01862 [Cryoendolithus antarcticus]|uniref:DUF7918 domain-containing protein n=1 Tax=Cryoendolithus antarcticus TaxID=1507870 RepID=A0A1V8TQG7_9PEZI|nr:hypothetical protein B0A48_01862 [Cryoendolithus antarcticus]